ncbi:hypothetical protein D9615_002393 [Tricholomella constricta]|uniref:Tetraspanin n=1 Tax=Tricholomella constricta TaxID=117010 RepID=A0A8H5HMN5_9AGAR|nr:hypothetical protein D9615_002393 [Tricholomella constricta]
MTVVSTRTFCCCIPTRFGVVIIALIGLLGGGVISIAGGINAHLLSGSKVSIGILIAVYALLAFVSLLGLVGAIGRKLALIKLYFTILLAHLLFSMGMGIYAIFRVFKDSSTFMDACMSSKSAASVENPKQLCVDGLKLLKGLSVTLFIIFWLIEIWGCVIVNSYAGQLADENAVEGVVKDTEAW